MLGTLQPVQIEKVLKDGLVGRIGCHVDGKTYVVPISYAYDGEFIYCHTYEGQKTAIMRKNPNICFEVEEIKDMANWKTVILQGEFLEPEEQNERNKAMNSLLKRYLPIISSETTHLGKHWPFHSQHETEIDGIVFKIKINEKYGRFESGEFPLNRF